MPICTFCATISLSEMRGPQCDQMQPHQPSYLALQRSAKTGCQLCHFLWVALAEGVGRDGRQGVNRAALAHVSEKFPGRQISLVAWGGAGNASNLDHINIITTGEIPTASDSEDDDAPADPTMHPDHQVALSGVVDLYAFPDDPAAWHAGVSGRPLPRNAGDSKEDFELISHWMADCLNSHRMCQETGPRAFLPTRVIEVGPLNGCTEPFLLEPCGRTGLYTTLSHCWGGEVPLTTTTTTLESRKISIPLASLPKTFQDAVIITRRLGIRFLWIDSLCILQDSREDWETESRKMGQIYASCHLNIAARGAINARSGCFFEREPEPPACRLTYESPDKSIEGSMYIRDPSYQSERLRDTPLDNRGWVLQERLLSPRIVHYGRQQLYWECLEATIRQDAKHPDVTTDELRYGVDFKQSLHFDAAGALSTKAQRMVDDPSQQKQREAAKYLRWYNIVTEYTRRGLSFNSDKLPAIEGIARAFNEKFGATYVAGLWQEDLPAGLLWQLAEPGEETISKTLPSWSWARWNGIVHFWSQTRGFPMRVLDGACYLVETRCTSLTSNPYRDLHAKLYLYGRMLQVHYRKPSGSPDDYLEYTVFAMNGTPIGRIAFDSRHCQPNTFSCLLIHGGQEYAAALALEPDQIVTECYRRLGYVSVNAWKNLPDGRKPFMEMDAQTICLV